MEDAAADFRLILCAEGLGNGNRETGTQSQAQTDHQEVHGTCRADGGKALRAEKMADNGRIHKTVELLEQHAEQQGKRKGNNLLQGTSFRQIAGHGP